MSPLPFYAMTTDENELPKLLRQMVEDVKDPTCSYWIKANYFDVQPPTQRQVTRWWQAPLYVCYDRTGAPSLWNPQFEENAMQMDVILKNTLPAVYERIHVEYDQITTLSGQGF